MTGYVSGDAFSSYPFCIPRSFVSLASASTCRYVSLASTLARLPSCGSQRCQQMLVRRKFFGKQLFAYTVNSRPH